MPVTLLRDLDGEVGLAAFAALLRLHVVRLDKGALVRAHHSLADLVTHQRQLCDDYTKKLDLFALDTLRLLICRMI